MGIGPAEILRRFPGYGLAALLARDARACAQAVGRDPLPDDSTHGYVAGAKPQRVRKKLAEACRWVLQPTAPE
jgi:hypothetical protein